MRARASSSSSTDMDQRRGLYADGGGAPLAEKKAKALAQAQPSGTTPPWKLRGPRSPTLEPTVMVVLGSGENMRRLKIALLALSIPTLLWRWPADGTDGSDDAGSSEPHAGEALFSANCAGCHGADGTGNGANPDLTQSTESNTDEQLKDIITNGQGSMPAYGMTLTEEEIDDLVGYLHHLFD